MYVVQHLTNFEVEKSDMLRCPNIYRRHNSYVRLIKFRITNAEVASRTSRSSRSLIVSL